MRLFFGFLLSLVLTGSALAAEFTLSSPDLREGGGIAAAQVYGGFGCSGGNVSPALSWSNPPAGTKSFALTVYDPDAPTGSGWWHWVVFNIPASARALAAGAGSGKAALPAGSVQSRTDFGAPGYGGPCPPPGKPHRYVFTLRALDVDRLDLAENSSGALVGFNLNAHTLAKASLTAHYGR
ncbi:MAG: kinase inhibitor [Humidesulfovibrio sp.]|nr:kinase inhibitor [Humidesulfovibrio sp.]